MDEYRIVNIDKLEFADEVEELNLWSNKIANYDSLVARLKLMPNLKAVWLNDNPVSEPLDFIWKLYKDLPSLQIINKQLTPSSTDWVLKVLCRMNTDIPLNEILSLDLSGRHIEYFKPEFFDHLPKLREVDISNNEHLVFPLNNSLEFKGTFKGFLCFV
jgi:Leucine-rich repeat (LRR) protein